MWNESTWIGFVTPSQIAGAFLGHYKLRCLSCNVFQWVLGKNMINSTTYSNTMIQNITKHILTPKTFQYFSVYPHPREAVPLHR